MNWADLGDRRRTLVAFLLGSGILLAYLALRAGGVGASVLVALAVTCSVLLVLRAEPTPMASERALLMADLGLLALPGLITVYLSFAAGGYFPAEPAGLAIVLLVILALRVVLSEHPFAGFSVPLAIAAGAFALYAVWILLSGIWSDAPARALLEFDRALFYLLALVLFGSVPRSSDRLRWMVRGLAVGIAVVATCALIARTLPDVWSVAPNVANNRLSYPLTYWNALGILGALGAILCLHLTSSIREPLAARVLAAAALPVLAAAVLFTFSRGAIAAGAIGLIAYALLARPRGLLSGVIAAVPVTVIAVVTAYQAHLLASEDPTTAAAASQGHDVALVVVFCALAAAGLRLALSPLDRRLEGFHLPEDLRQPITVGAWSGFAVITLVVLLALGVPGALADHYDKFVHTTNLTAEAEEDRRARLIDPANNGRIDEWRAAMRGFAAAELKGEGAGTYALLWRQERPASLAGLNVEDAHSLYPETLGELGLVGMALLAITLVAILVSVVPLRRGQNRSLYAALFAVGLAWTIHAGVDWDWEMPAVSGWFFMLGGAALATHRRGPSRLPIPTPRVRVAVGLGLVALAIVPGTVLVSQTRLDTSIDAFHRGDCEGAVAAARSSISALGSRPEPYEVLALCHIREGAEMLAVQDMNEALDHDPRDWRLHYRLALARAAGGMDAREAAQTAGRLNPHEPRAQDLLTYLRRDDADRLATRARAIANRERITTAR